MPTKKQIEAQGAEVAAAELREIFPPGSTATVLLRHVSASGMTRSISLISPDVQDVTYLLVRLGLGKFDSHGGIKRGGCGMDMGFDLVYSMSRALYPGGFECVGTRCPSNDHSNVAMYRAAGQEVPTHHTDGGYAVSHRWL